MQRGLLLGAGAVILIAGGALALRAVSHHQVTGVAEQKVDRELAELLSGASITHGPIVEDGLTGTATVHDLSVARPDGEAWTAATMVLAGVHAAALRDVFDPASYPNGHPAWTDRRALLRDMTLTNVRVSMAGDQPGVLTIDKAELHGLRGRPFASAPTAQNRAQPGFAADAALAFAYDSERITGLAASLQGPNPFKMTVASAGGSGYDSGKLAALDMASLVFDGSTGPKHTPIHLSVGSAGLKGADATGLLGAMHAGDASAAMRGLTYGSVDSSAMALQISPGPLMTIHDFHAEQEVAEHGGLARGHGHLTGMTLGLGDMPVPPSAASGIAAFGMNTITLDIDASTQGTPGGGTEFAEDVSLHSLGTLHVKGSFSGYAAPAGPAPAAAASIAALLGTTLQQATLVWDDGSLTNRVFKVVADQTHTSPALIRAQLAMPIVALGVMLPEQPDAADQLTRFLDNPHRLTITLNPPQKVSLGQVAAAPALQRAQLLGVRISSQ